jgi:hypothetical protein
MATSVKRWWMLEWPSLGREGPARVVRRAVTRAAGVRPNAAYRHFADRDQLLGAVATLCLEGPTDRTQIVNKVIDVVLVGL